MDTPVAPEAPDPAAAEPPPAAPADLPDDQAAATAHDEARVRANPRRSVDLVLFGATGFTGSLVAEYLSRKAPPGTRVALAGRNEEKLSALRSRLAGAAHQWPLIVADSGDRTSLDRMAAGATAVISTVGPFNEHGIELVGACAENGTHYADITGEVLFMRDSIDRYDAAARASGARIVHSCGFDSIPSDLGVFVLHLAAKDYDGVGHLTGTHMVVRGGRGGLSGGTIHSFFAEMRRAEQDDSARKTLADPYSLSPDRAEEPGSTRDTWGVHYDDVLGVWVGPFFMAAINTRVVRRSNALSGYSYGRDFRYDEGVATGGGVTGRIAATALAGGMAAMRGAMAVGAARQLAEKLLPDPGEGPGERTRNNGYFSITLHSRTPQRALLRATVAAQGDPGYAATSLMLGQAGLTLAGDQQHLPDAAGVLTPSTAMGMQLVDNLKIAGMTITAERV